MDKILKNAVHTSRPRLAGLLPNNTPALGFPWKLRYVRVYCTRFEQILTQSRRAISNCIEHHMDNMMAMIRSDLQLVKARTADNVQPETVRSRSLKITDEADTLVDHRGYRENS